MCSQVRACSIFISVLISELRLALAFLDRKARADSVEQIVIQHQKIMKRSEIGRRGKKHEAFDQTPA